MPCLNCMLNCLYPFPIPAARGGPYKLQLPEAEHCTCTCTCTCTLRSTTYTCTNEVALVLRSLGVRYPGSSGGVVITHLDIGSSHIGTCNLWDSWRTSVVAWELCALCSVWRKMPWQPEPLGLSCDGVKRASRVGPGVKNLKNKNVVDL